MSVLQKTLVSLLIVSYGVSCSTPPSEEVVPNVQVKTLMASQVVVSDTVNPVTVLDDKGKVVRQFPADPGANVVFFPDHQRVLIQDATGQAQVYSLMMGANSGIKLSDSSAPYVAAGSYGNQYFVALSPDGSVASWDQKGALVKTLGFAGVFQTGEAYKGGFFKNDGSLVLVNGGSLAVVDPTDGTIFDQKDAVSADKITALAVEGDTLVVGDTQGVVKTWTWDGKQHKLTAESTVANFSSPIFFVDIEEGGARVLMMSKEGSGQIFQRMPAMSCSVVLSTPQSGNPIRGGLTKSFLWTIDAQGQVAKWDSAAGCGTVSAVAVYGGPGARSEAHAFVAPDEKNVLTIASGTGSQLWTINASKNIVINQTASSKGAFSPKGNSFAVVESFLLFGTSLDLWSYPGVGNNPALIGSVKMDGPFSELAFSPDGNVIALAADTYGDVNLYSTTPTKDTKELPVRAFLNHEKAGLSIKLVFSPDSSLLATGGKDGTVKLWDATQADGKEIAMPKTTFQAGDTILSLEFSQDGKYLVTASEGNKAQLWDATGAVTVPLATFTHRTRTNSARFSLDGNYIITAGDDSIQMWPVTSRDGSNPPAMPVAVFSACAREVALSPGGNYIATACQVFVDAQGKGSSDPSIHVWDLRARGNVTKSLVEFKTKNKSPGELQFSPTGQFILVSGAEANLGELWSIGVPLLGVYKIPVQTPPSG